MEAEKWLGPTLTLVITTETLEKDSHLLCDLLYGLHTHSSPPPTRLCGRLPPCVQGYGAVRSDRG